MRRAYFDSSAIAKLVREEVESSALVDYLEEPMEATTSVVSEIEVIRALARHHVPAADVADAMRGFILVAVDERVRATAAALEPATLRLLDALHLATALAVGPDGLELVTYDDRLAEAARTHGVRVAQPGRPARVTVATRTRGTGARRRVHR